MSSELGSRKKGTFVKKSSEEKIQKILRKNSIFLFSFSINGAVNLITIYIEEGKILKTVILLISLAKLFNAAYCLCM